jgi:hypothetical protein
MHVEPVTIIVHAHRQNLLGYTGWAAIDTDGSAVWRNPRTNQAERLPAGTFGILNRR